MAAGEPLGVAGRAQPSASAGLAMGRMIPRDHLPRLRYSDIDRLGTVMTGLQALQASIARSRVTGAEVMAQQCSDMWDLIVAVASPAQRAIANWDAAHPAVNPPEEQSGGTAPAL